MRMNSNDDILSVLNGQNSVLTYAFNPENIAFRNKVIGLQKNCSMVEWEHDMGKTIPYCKLDHCFCNGQCTFKSNDCPCNIERGVK